jgi:hypothetical protein
MTQMRKVDPRDLLGTTEAAEVLGWVDSRKVSVYLSRGVFPEPIMRLAMGPLWTRSQVDDYQKLHQIRTGGVE